MHLTIIISLVYIFALAKVLVQLPTSLEVQYTHFFLALYSPLDISELQMLKADLSSLGNFVCLPQ